MFSLTNAPETKGFIGERFDADAGLQYLNARYYDPKLGMFLQPDWWEVTQAGVGTNRYGYSFGDPVNSADPSGHGCILICGGGTIASILQDIFGGPMGSRSDASANAKATADRMRDSAVSAAKSAGSAAKTAMTVALDLSWVGDARDFVDGVRTRNKTKIALAAAAALPLGKIIGLASDATKIVGKSGKMASGTAAQTTKATEEAGVVYKRTDPTTGCVYVGQCKSDARFAARQGEHDGALGVQHEYDVLGRAEPGRDLDVLEESFIRGLGGTQTRGGPLANMRHQMSDTRYRAAGGSIALPYDGP